MSLYTEGKDFKGLNHSAQTLPKGEYEHCTFTGCHFADGHLSNYTFLECTFVDCDFSNTHLGNTAFRQVFFKDCKMVGAHFNECNSFLLEMSFEACLMQLASFYSLPLGTCRFHHCQLPEADFTEANLSASVIRNCDLSQAVFEQTNLEKADLRGSYGFTLDPELNRVKGLKISKDSLGGLLAKYQLHVE